MKWILLSLLLFMGKLEPGENEKLSPYPIEAKISLLNEQLKAQEEMSLQLTLKNTGKEPVEFCLPLRSFLGKQKTPHVFVSLKSKGQLCGQQVYSRISELWSSNRKDRFRLGVGRKKKFRFNPLEILVDCEFEEGEGLRAGTYYMQIILANSFDCFESFDTWGAKEKSPIIFRSQELKFEVLKP